MQELLPERPIKRAIITKGVIEIAIYIALLGSGLISILFTKSSIDTIMLLDSKIERLKTQIDTLNKTNAKLQKDYFELLSIQGDYDN